MRRPSCARPHPTGPCTRCRAHLSPPPVNSRAPPSPAPGPRYRPDPTRPRLPGQVGGRLPGPVPGLGSGTRGSASPPPVPPAPVSAAIARPRAVAPFDDVTSGAPLRGDPGEQRGRRWGQGGEIPTGALGTPGRPQGPLRSPTGRRTLRLLPFQTTLTGTLTLNLTLIVTVVTLTQTLSKTLNLMTLKTQTLKRTLTITLMTLTLILLTLTLTLTQILTLT